jgi:S1-C subfamily serine protease
LLVGDLITQWNGEEVTRVRAIMHRLGPSSVGTTVTLQLVRGGAPLEKPVTIGERPRG